MISRAQLTDAVGRALAGKWREAHEIVQQDDDDQLACWIHAVLHREEGDLPNARYWYARCGKELPESISTGEELREIRARLGD